ncbi:MAG: hypothetical protein AAFP70_07230 [Calditrichota bacterium]
MLKEYLQRWQNGDRTIAELQHKALQDDTFPKYLNWLAERVYHRNALTVGKNSFPVSIFPSRFNQENNFAELLGALSTTAESSLPKVFAEPGKLYLETLQQRSPGLWNGPTYCMSRLDLLNGLQVNCKTGNYFDALISCDLLEFELLTTFGDKQPHFNDYAAFTDSLQLRSALHQRGNPLLEDCGRSAAIGISTSILHRSRDGWRMLLRTCAPKIADKKHLLHVIPSGMMQPHGNAERDYSILPTIYREYLEEVWLEEEAAAKEGNLDSLLQIPRLQSLHSMLSAGKAILQFTGIAADLLKLRPEICMQLILTDSQWYEELHETMSDRDDFYALRDFDELASIQDRLAELRMISVPLNAAQEGFELLQRMPFSPPGAAAFFMSWKHAQRLISLLSFKGVRW